MPMQDITSWGKIVPWHSMPLGNIVKKSAINSISTYDTILYVNLNTHDDASPMSLILVLLRVEQQ